MGHDLQQKAPPGGITGYGAVLGGASRSVARNYIHSSGQTDLAPVVCRHDGSASVPSSRRSPQEFRQVVVGMRREQDADFFNKIIAIQQQILRAIKTWSYSLLYLCVLMTAWFVAKILGLI